MTCQQHYTTNLKCTEISQLSNKVQALFAQCSVHHCSVVLRAKTPLNTLYGPGGIFLFSNKYQYHGLLFRDLQRAIHRRPGMLKDIHRRFIMYQLLSATRYLHAGNGKHNLFCISVYCVLLFIICEHQIQFSGSFNARLNDHVDCCCF